MPPIPTPNHQDWKTRPSLASWTGLKSNAYPAEILSCVKEREPLGWRRLSANPITRSVRLLSILKMCFEHHPKATLVIRNYEEVKGFDRCCGFECLRLLAREFSIKTRTELLFFRSQLANSTIAPNPFLNVSEKSNQTPWQRGHWTEVVRPIM